MTWVVVGLGNPGDEYKGTRHNVGRIVLEHFAKRYAFDSWKENKKTSAHIAKGVIGDNQVILVAPDTYMNKSGTSVVPYVKSTKAAERMIVVYDDLDLPLGSIKLSYDRGSGGHRGLESIIRSLKTRQFIRVRVGVSPTTPSGKLKKPHGEQEVLDFILSPFKTSELLIFKKVIKSASEAIETIIADGRERAMNALN